MKIVWSPRAIRHLTELRDYVDKDNPSAAHRLATRIVGSFELLEGQPLMGRTGRVAGTRELVIPDSPYIVPYRIRGERLDLLAVFHGRQKWPKRL